MAKKKKTSAKVDNRKIQSEEQAAEYAKKFKLLENTKIVYVTEDGYLYYDSTAAVNFAKKKELFTVKLK